jgi:hypothetical protein
VLYHGVDYLINWKDEVNLVRLLVVDGLVYANQNLNEFFIATIYVDVSKRRLLQPYVDGAVNKLIRDLLGNRPQDRDDLSLDGIDLQLQVVFK